MTTEDKMASILLSRIILIVAQMSLVLFSLIILIYSYSGFGYSVLALLGLGAVILFIFLMVNFLNKKQWSIPLMKAMASNNIYRKLISQLKIAWKYILIHPKHLMAKAYVYSLLHWMMGACEIFLILYLLGVNPDLVSCITVDSGVVLAKSICGFVPGQIGVEELANRWMLVITGMGVGGVWLTLSMIRRGRQLFWIAMSTIFYFITNHKSKKDYGHIIYHT